MDLVTAWRKWNPDSTPYMLGADANVLKHSLDQSHVVTQRTPNFPSGDKRLHLALLPLPFLGDVLKASIYVLMLNPGLAKRDYEWDENPSFRRALLANLRQERLDGVMPFIYLDPQFEKHDGSLYWYGRLKKVVHKLADARRTSTEEARSEIAEKLAVIELVPYHSSTGSLVGRLDKDRLPSMHLAQEFVGTTVVERVRKKEAIIIVVRQVNRWNQCLPANLTEKQGIFRYTWGQARAASFNPASNVETPGGRAILRYLGVNAKG